MKTAKDILKTKSSEIWSLSPKDKVFDALKMMGEKEIGSIMVIDDKGKVVGIITERDYARKIILLGKASKETNIEEIMTPYGQMYTVKPDTTVDDCMVLMTAKKIRHIPVFQGEKFLGIITIGDVVKSIISEQEMLIEHLSNYIAGKYV